METVPSTAAGGAPPSAAATERASLQDIEAIYVRDRLRYVRVAAGIVGDQHEANDVVQEAFADAVRARSTYRGGGALEAWLWRLVVNAAHSSRRKRTDIPDGGDGVRREMGHEEAHEPGSVLRAAIAALPERQRVVLFLRYYADLDYAAIGEALGMRTGTVSSTLSHAHRAIRAALTEAAR